MSKRANGEGSIYKRGDGRWCATVTLDSGRRKAFYGDRREDVARKLAVALKARQDGLPVPAERQTVAQYLAGWLESTRPSLRPRTWIRYEEYVRLHAIPEVGKVSLSRLSPQHLQRLYASRLESGLSPTTVAHLHAVLHRALYRAARLGLVPRNVAALVEPPRIKRREMMTLCLEQSNVLLRAAKGDRLEALYVLALTIGMRQGELLALRWRDVDIEGRMIRVTGTMQRTPDGLNIAEPKTASSRRHVAITDRAVDALRRHETRQKEERLRLGEAWEKSELVFANEVGRGIEAGNLIRRSFHPLLERAGLPRIRFHDLRHRAATLMLAGGVHAKVVAEMLGHSQIAVTLDLYSHVTPTLQRQATDTLDALLQA